MTTATYLDDATLLKDFRDLFRLSLDDVEGLGISRSTWARIETGQEHTHRPGVSKRLAVMRRLMNLVNQMPYGDARAWAVRPIRSRGKAPKGIVAANLFGLNTLLTTLTHQSQFRSS